MRRLKICLLIFLHMQERFYFGDHVLPLFETGIPLLKQRLHQLPASDKVCSITMVLYFCEYFGLVCDRGDDYLVIAVIMLFYFFEEFCSMIGIACLLSIVFLQFNCGSLQIVVAFPDDGAWKRFHKLLDHLPTVGLDFFLKCTF